MVSYRAPIIEMWLKSKGVTLSEVKGHGIVVNLDQDKRNILLEDLRVTSLKGFYLKPVERQNLMLFLILTIKEPLTAKSLANRFGVSRTTSMSDLNNIKQQAERYGLELVRHRNFGTEIIGTERALRIALLESILRIVSEQNLIRLCLGENWALDEFAYPPYVHEYLMSLNLSESFKFIQNIELHLNTQYVDYSRLRLSLYLGIMLRRLLNSHQLKEVNASKLDNVDDELKTYLANKVNEQISIDIPETEFSLLAIQFMSSEFLEANIPKDIEGFVEDRAHQLTQNMIDYLARRIHPWLKVDNQLQSDFLDQISLTIKRTELSYAVNNPFLAKFSANHKHVFRVIKEGYSKYAADINVSDDEVAYLGMFLLAALENLRAKRKFRVIVVCTAGLAGARLLTNRLRNEIPEIEVVRTIPAMELKSLGKLQLKTDAIISTVKIQSPNDVPLIVVSPFLDDGDIDQIRSLFKTTFDVSPDADRLSSPISKEGGLLELLNQKYIDVRLKARHWKEVVDLSAEPLLKTGVIQPSFIDAIKRYLEEYGPYMVLWPQVALLHARPEDGAQKLGISIQTLSHPVAFAEAEEYQVQIAITFATPNYHSSIYLLEQLSDLLSSPKFFYQAIELTDKVELLNLIKITLMNKAQ